jgi:hypothetical protein
LPLPNVPVDLVDVLVVGAPDPSQVVTWLRSSFGWPEVLVRNASGTGTQVDAQ